MTRFEELINLINSFRNEIIDLDFFCGEFYRVYFDVLPDEKIPQHHDKYLKELALMCIRYKKEKNTPTPFYSKKDILTKIGCWGKSI